MRKEKGELLNGTLAAAVKYGTIIAVVALQTGVLLARTDRMRDEVAEARSDLKATNEVLRQLQLQQAVRSGHSVEVNWRLKAIERRLEQLSGPLERRHRR